jgi:hypothetical protein
MHWKGLSGGAEVWKELGGFFENLKTRSVEFADDLPEDDLEEKESHA